MTLNNEITTVIEHKVLAQLQISNGSITELIHSDCHKTCVGNTTIQGSSIHHSFANNVIIACFHALELAHGLFIHYSAVFLLTFPKTVELTTLG